MQVTPNEAAKVGMEDLKNEPEEFMNNEKNNTPVRGGGGIDGRALAMARDAWKDSDEARMLANDRNGPVGGKYLRNRLEVAFCAGYEAAMNSIDASPKAGSEAVDAERYRWLRAKLVAANFHPECPNGLDLGEGVALIFMLPLGAHVNPDLDWTIDQARGKENSNG